jgi:hypothetical protein
MLWLLLAAAVFCTVAAQETEVAVDNSTDSQNSTRAAKGM